MALVQVVGKDQIIIVILAHFLKMILYILLDLIFIIKYNYINHSSKFVIIAVQDT